MRRRWTTAEIDALRAAVVAAGPCADGPTFWRHVARACGRPWRRVQDKAHRLGLRAKIHPGSRAASRWHS